MKKNIKNRGLILINVLIFAVIAVTVTVALINWATTMIQTTRQLVSREQAFQIAESGVEYYRSFLADNPGSYAGGMQDFLDKNGNVIGQFILTITPPSATSSVVTVMSEGITGNSSRTIQTTLTVPSLATYSIVSNDTLFFKAGEEFFGPIHSNDEIEFNGTAHNLVTSSKENGVYTSGGGVFLAGTEFPVDEIDFSSIADDLLAIKTAAQANSRYFGDSGDEGYRVLLKTDDTFDLYRVKDLDNENQPCENDNPNQDGWGTWSVKNETLLGTHSFPVDGAIFFDDHVWIEGQINTARLIIGSSKNIIVNKDLVYTNYDGQDAIGLIAQGNLNIGLESENDLRIDAALVSQNDRVGRHYYSDRCQSSSNVRNSITLYGMIATYDRHEFSYSDNTGYINRSILYDPYLSSRPLPYFPKISNQYKMLSWDEIK